MSSWTNIFILIISLIMKIFSFDRLTGWEKLFHSVEVGYLTLSQLLLPLFSILFLKLLWVVVWSWPKMMFTFHIEWSLPFYFGVESLKTFCCYFLLLKLLQRVLMMLTELSLFYWYFLLLVTFKFNYGYWRYIWHWWWLILFVTELIANDLQIFWRLYRWLKFRWSVKLSTA